MVATVKQVDSDTIAEVLRIRHAIDPAASGNEVDDGEAHPWIALLRGFGHQDVIDAVWAHYTREARAVWPADVIARMEALAAERQHDALSARQAAQEEQADWSLEDKAAWSVAWDLAIGRGATVRKARADADETHPEPAPEPEPEAEPDTDDGPDTDGEAEHESKAEPDAESESDAGPRGTGSHRSDT